MPAPPAARRRTSLSFLLVLALLVGCDGGEPQPEGDAFPDPDGDGIAFQGTQVRIDLRSERGSALAADGGFLFLGDVETIVINAGGTIHAFHSVCPSDACDVDHFAANRMVCACDGSAFGTAGQPVEGAARSALQKYLVTRSGDVVTVVRTSNEPPSGGFDPDPEPPPYTY